MLPFGQHPKEAAKGSDAFLNFVNEQKENHIQAMKKLSEVGTSVASLYTLMKNFYFERKNELTVMNTSDQDFYSEGYNFSSIYVSDVAAADSPQLIVKWQGMTMTKNLLAGENAVDIPEGATFSFTTTSGNAWSIVLSRYNFR